MNNLHKIVSVIVPIEYRVFCADRNRGLNYPLYKWFVGKQELWINNPLNINIYSRAGMEAIKKYYLQISKSKYRQYYDNAYLLPPNLKIEP